MAHALGEHRVLDVGQAGAVLLVGQKEVPESGRARLLLQRLELRRDDPAVGRVAVEHRQSRFLFEWRDLLVMKASTRSR